jgi:syntaxin-binding protein 1
LQQAIMADTLQTLTRTRLMEEMLGRVQEGEWAVLVMDPQSTRIMSAACRISEILNYGVALVDDLFKRREPQRQAAGIYFVTPAPASIAKIVEDWQNHPTYASAHIFFTSKVAPQHLAALKGCPGLLSRLRALAEVNVEYLQVDTRTFTTDEEGALGALFGEGSDEAPNAGAALRRTAARLATVFATMKEMPAIRFRAAKPPDMDADDSPVLEARALVPQRLAIELDAQLQGMQAAGLLPPGETCEVVIMDRGFDPVAPVIHDWTYEPLVYDLLAPQGSVFKYHAQTQGGQLQEKEHMLNEKDGLWLALRHRHFADACAEIAGRMDEFRSKNAAARRTGAEDALDVRNMRRLVQALPQYREQLSQLSVHVEMASGINRALEADQLTAVGKLEQDVVFGEVTSKHILEFFTAYPDLSPEAKARLFMCYVATHPEKLDEQRAEQWRKVTRLTPQQFAAVSNLEYLGVPVYKRASSGSGLFFNRKRKRNVRKDREGAQTEEQWELSRFYPLLQDIFEDMAAGRLSSDEYPYVRQPSASAANSFAVQPMANSYTAAKSVRSNKPSWATRAGGGGAPGGGAGGGGAPMMDPLAAPSQTGRGGKRIVGFIIGGATRSEVRVAHQLAGKLGRDVTLGATSIDTPASFLAHMRSLSGAA